MSKLVWDRTGERLYETGVKKGVLYPQESDGSYPKGVAWNGLTAVTESPSGAEIGIFFTESRFPRRCQTPVIVLIATNTPMHSNNTMVIQAVFRNCHLLLGIKIPRAKETRGHFFCYLMHKCL